ncbi:hypothetical protein [Vreelandella zhaodongensis]|uniref:hypothetical protein n=1 Tax=Vreelandella zhaodongensis TaxID=1176240 RepID=UPI003EBD1391
MSQNANLLVHIGPLREESETLLKQANLPTLLAPLSPTPARQQALAQVLSNMHVAEQPVTPPGGEAVCYTYALKDFNGLAPATELTSLYPGLGKARQQPIDTQTLPHALEQAGLNHATLTHLIIEQPEMALSLLQAFHHSGLLEQLTHLWVRTSPLRLYEGMATNDELTQWCEQQGFNVAAEHADDPDFFLLGFARNPLHNQLKHTQAQLAEHQTQLSQLTEERDTLKKQLNQALKASQQHQKQHQESEQKLKEAEQKQKETHTWFVNRKQQAEESAEQIKALEAKLKIQLAQTESLQEQLTASEEERGKYKSYFAARKKQHEEAEEKLKELQQAIKDKDATVSQLSEQLAALQQSNERFAQLENKLDGLFGEQKTYIQQTTNALGQHVTRSARQQRDEQALTHYLQYGQRPVNTELSPSYAVALLEHYDTNNHDVVVIFGSNETTELLAQSIINARAEQPKLTRQQGQEQEAHNEVTLSHADLPQTIVSIAHQKAASDELKKRLNSKRLSHAVNVVYAPWVECEANGQAALFYAAEPTLQRLNQWLPEEARVLIIVGEALPEAGHSREGALPLLLQQLPTQRLDIVLEGNNYSQESGLTTHWNTLLETRQRPGQWLTLPNTHSLRVEG